MADCEMCGRKGAGVKRNIESTIMNVCLACSKYGLEVSMPKKISAKIIRNYAPKEFTNPDADARIIQGFGSLLKNAREKMSLKQEQVANKLNERESLINNIESGRFKPSLKTARKLEKFFNITLIENNSFKNFDANDIQSDSSGEQLTMGDLLKQALEK